MNKAIMEICRPGSAAETREMAQESWLIGREQGDLIMNDPLVSSRHARLELGPGSLRYTDLGSTNGSYMGSSSERLASPIELKDGDVIRLGSSIIKITNVPPPAVPSGTVLMDSPASLVAMPVRPAGLAPAPIPALQPQPPQPQPMAAPGQAVAGAIQPHGPDADAPPSAYSHPGQPVRHSYPLASRDAGLGTAVGLLMKTLPYAMARFGILLAFSVATIIWFVLTGGGAIFLASKVELLGWIWAGGGMVVYGWAWWFVIRYFMYLLKAGHIAVLTELLTKNRIGNGEKGMFAYGTEVVKSRFGQVNAMFALDLLIHGVVRAFNRTLDFITGLLPIPGLSSLIGVINSILYAATTYIDETLFSYNLARGDDNVWRSSRDGLIYYAQNAREVLKTGVWIVVLDKVLTVVVWVVMLAPAFVISYLMPSSLASWGTIISFAIAVLFASNIRGAFLKPLFLIMVMTRFHTCVQDQAIDEVWDQRLTAASDKFRKIKDRALEPTSGQPAPAAA